MNSGCGLTHMIKQLRIMDIPTMGPNCFERYERIVGQKAEECAKESCTEAAVMERELSIENIETIKNVL